MSKKRSIRKGLIMTIVLAVTAAVILSAAILVSASSEDKAECVGVQVTTDGNVNLRFYYKLTGNVKRARVTVADPDTKEGEWSNKSFKYDSDKGMSYVNVPLAAAQMTFEVSVQPLVGNTASAVGQSSTWSIKDYADVILTKSSDTKTEAEYASNREAIKAILNYGAMAQERFGVAQNALANDGVYSRSTNPIDNLELSVSDQTGITHSGQTNKLGYKDRSVSLESNISLKIYFKYSGNAALTATLSRTRAGAANPEYTVADKVHRVDGTDTYYVTFDNIPTSYYADVYKATVTDGAESVTVTTSILDCIGQLSKSQDEQDVNIALSMYNYYKWTTGISTEGCAHAGVHFEATERGSDVSQAICSNCGKAFGHNVPDSINYYSAPNAYDESEGTKNVALDFSNGRAYCEITGASGAGSDSHVNLVSTAANGAESLKIPINSGRFFVIKVKSSQNVSKLAFMAAVDTNGDGAADADEAYLYMHLPHNGEQMIVIDINACAQGNTFSSYPTDTEGVKSIFASLKLYNAFGIADDAQSKLEIEYFAVCDDWAEVAAIAGADNSENYTCHYYRADYQYDTVTLIENGEKCQIFTMTAKNDKAVRYECNLCGKTVTTAFNKEINYFHAASMTTIGNGWHGSTDKISYFDADEGVIYQRVMIQGDSSTGRGSTVHFTTGGYMDTFDRISGGSGRYLVFKIRTNNVSLICLRLASLTEQQYSQMSGSDLTEYIKPTDGYKYPRAWAYNDQWATVVVDLAAVNPEKYSVNNGLVEYVAAAFQFVKNNGNSGYIDFSYFAIVDDLSEAEDIIKSGSYLLTNWKDSAAMTNKTIADGSVPDTEYDDVAMKESYVGHKWNLGDFVNTSHTVPSAYTSMSASDMLAALKAGTLTGGKAYKVTGTLVLSSNTTYNGNGAIVIADKLSLSGTSDVTVSNLLVVGAVDVSASSNIVFKDVYVRASNTAISVDDYSFDVTVKDCYLLGDSYAVQSYGDGVVFYNCYVQSAYGIVTNGDACIVQNCYVKATGTGMTAIALKGNDCVIRNNTIESSGKGILLEGNSNTPYINALVALNKITAPNESIRIRGAFNASVILNSTGDVLAENNTNIYLVDNTIRGKLELKNNNYIIAENNAYQSLDCYANANANGNTITDVDARVEYGANEEILPHTNKELFVGMIRKTSVSDASLPSSKTINTYLMDLSATNEIVIVPPGAYASTGPTTLSAQHSNTTVYAYGVYHEYAETDPSKANNLNLRLMNAKNVSIYGMTIGYSLPSSGQVRVVEKINDNGTYKFRVVADAGFLDGFTTTNPELYHSWWPEIFLFDEEGNHKMYTEENPKTKHKAEYSYDENGEYDGTIIITLTLTGTNEFSESKSSKHLWDKVQEGNVITCRFAYGIQTVSGTVNIAGCSNVEFKDTVTYGYAGSLCVLTTGNGKVNFIRHHNTAHSESVIDKATYDKYVALENKWGVDFEVREEVLEDGTVRYRGPFSRSGSVDAFHMSADLVGLNITSSLLENMVDDGSNQHAASSRLHAYKDNGDGTVTFYYKGLVSSNNWSGSTGAAQNVLAYSSCKPFAAGDRIYIYAPSGATVCDTVVLSAWKEAAGNTTNQTGVEVKLTYGGVSKHLWIDLYAVKVLAADVNFESLIDPFSGYEYDLSQNGYEYTNRVVVDNLSRNDCGYTLDNVMVDNGHSRGFLVKSTNVTIKHCTFRNVPNSGLLIDVEPGPYAESSVARNIRIQKCLFDNVGYMFDGNSEKGRACIRINGESTIVDEGTLPINNIVIDGCKFVNNKQQTAIWVDSAQDIVIRNNVFEPIVLTAQNLKGVAVLLENCADVEISDNTYNYSHFSGDMTSVIKGTNYARISGTDVTRNDGTPMFADTAVIMLGDGATNYKADLSHIQRAWGNSTYNVSRYYSEGGYVRCTHNYTYAQGDGNPQTSATFLASATASNASGNPTKQYYTTASGSMNTGNYLVIRFRGELKSSSYVKFMLSSNCNNTSTSVISAGAYNNRGLMSANGHFDGEWHVLVVRIGSTWSGGNYPYIANSTATSVMYGFQVDRIETGDYFDISLFAICDTWEEIDALVDEQYCDYSYSGTSLYKNVDIGYKVENPIAGE